MEADEVPDGEVVLLDQEHAQAAPGRIAGDAGAVDAAPDDGEVEIAHDPDSLPR